MIITLEILSDVYSKPDKNGNQKLIKRNVISKKQFESTSILVEQHITSKGVVSKKWCNIKCGEDYYRINKKFEDVEKLTSHLKIGGFKCGNSKKI